MRGKAIAILAVAVLLVLMVAQPVFSAGAKEKAPAEGGIGKRLVLYSSMTENDLTNLLKGFKALYPDVEVEVVNGSAGELTARIAAERNRPQGDLMWGGLSDSDGMMYSEIFEHWLTEYEPQIYPAYQSNNGFYSLDHLSTIVFCVNTDLEKELGLEIKGYQDLLDPRLKGRIVMPDPNSSSSAWNNVCNMLAVFGYDTPEFWDYVTKFLNQNITISSSSSVAFRGVYAGEYVVGLTYEDGASTLLKSGATNIRMVYPLEGASALAFGCAVIKGAPNPEGAKAMINYLMSPEGQSQLGNAQGTLRFTNSKAVYNTPYLPATADIKWVDRDIDWLIANKRLVLDKWNNIFATIKR